MRRLDMADSASGGVLKLADDLVLSRMGFGAMQLAGANRRDDALVDRCAAEGIAYAAYFPLGGFTPLQSAALDRVAARLGVSPQQVALAWLLQRSPTMVLIPGTSSVAHVRENIAAPGLVLPPEAVTELDAIGR